jgi:peptidylprolyl isomerase
MKPIKLPYLYKEDTITMKDSRLLASLIILFMAVAFFSVSVVSAEESTKENDPPATAGKKVKVHYTLKVEGEVIDSSKEREPLEFQLGSSQVIPGFEKAVKDMKIGEKKSFQVSPAEGYGEEDPKAIQEVSKDKLPPDLKLAPGMTIYAKGQSGNSIPVRVVEVKKDVVVMNFNHPLAGKMLNFDVEILEKF